MIIPPKMQARISLLVRTLHTQDAASADATRQPGVADLVQLLTPSPDARHLWLAWSVLTGDLPSQHEVRWARRQVQLLGIDHLVGKLISLGVKSTALHGATIEVLTDSVLVDVFHTSQTELATGIQRVARETIKRWDSNHEIVFVTWTTDGRALRPLSTDERARALFGTKPASAVETIPRTRIVPWGGNYILPELGAEPWRTDRLGALAQYSGTDTGVIGFDCVPLTSVETVGEGMPAAFAGNLGAVAHMNRVSTISRAAGGEYSGWKRMLSAAGIAGPDIHPISLASSSESVPDDALAAASELFELVADEPLVLVVGSHEPRKNHVAVLAAAESLWLEGLRFRLVFIGGNSWKSEAFMLEAKRLEANGRSIVTASAIADSVLWAAYRLARFSVFPSFNEGFGLPVAESLSCGTPVVTSNYGSMREIADDGGGALLVDPYDDESIGAAMRTLLTNDAVLAELATEAVLRVPRTWETYASDLWTYFVDHEVVAGRAVSRSDATA